MENQYINQQTDFDFNEILKEYRSGKRLTGKGGLLAPLIKQLTEAALEAEVESHIAKDVLNGNRNRRNGVNKKPSEEKILSMYGLGMSYTDISSHIEDIYQVSISTITDKIIDKVKQWQSRPLK